MSKATPSPASTTSATPEPSIAESIAPSDAAARLGNSAFDWFSMIFDFIANISWPLLIAAILVTLLNKKIQSALSSGLAKLARTFKSFKFGGIEATLNDEEIKESLEENKESLEEDRSGFDESKKEFRDDKSPQSGLSATGIKNPPAVSREPAKDPRIIALEAYNGLESVIAATVEHFQGQSDETPDLASNRKYALKLKPRSMTQLLAELSSHISLSSSEITAVHTLREIRNSIAHDVSSVNMSAETANSYRELCRKIVRSIRRQVEAKALNDDQGPDGSQ